jgi:hypothetical protein
MHLTGSFLTLLALAHIVPAGLHAATIEISGSLTGRAEIVAGRCAPLATVEAQAAGSATGLGSFVDVQSHCTASASSFDSGIFDLASSTSDSSLFGTYEGNTSFSNGKLDFGSLLVVTGGTGSFSSAAGTIPSTGTLDLNTGVYEASFSGLVSTVPEPSTNILYGLSMIAITCRLLYWRRPRCLRF